MVEWSQIKEGDLVRLKSGGPVMTVTAKDPMRGQVQCQWFVGTELKNAVFVHHALVRVDPGEDD